MGGSEKVLSPAALFITMPKEIGKSTTRVGALSRSVRARQRSLSASVVGEHGLIERTMDSLATPRLTLGLLIAMVFVVSATFMMAWSRNFPLVEVGRIMNETRIVRYELASEDRAQTQQAREQARQATPRVFIADLGRIDSLIASIEALPRQLAAAESLAAVPDPLKIQFALNEEIFNAVRSEAPQGELSTSWISKTSTLRGVLQRLPIVDRATWQLPAQEGTSPEVRLMVDGQDLRVFKREVVNAEDAGLLADAVGDAARIAGFTGALRTAIVNRFMSDPKPTFSYDAAITAQEQNVAAAAVQPLITINPVGQVIYQRGERLTQPQVDLYSAELLAFQNSATTWQWLARYGGLLAAAIGITVALAGYTVLFCPRASNGASRMGGVALVLLVALVLACVATATNPGFIAATSVTPTIFVAMLMTVAYDRRSALAYGILHGLLVCIALRLGIGSLMVMVAGIACVVWSLKEIRDRNSLLRTSLFTAIIVGVTTAIAGSLERPLVDGVLREFCVDGGLAAAGCLLAGGITVFVLPIIERTFNVTTGMTLIELRDPKQPLLRELQVRAPGTYNHSLNVASICETAAEAIGGDGLLAYVGALYHDVGKMNKPEYFVENQAGGPNRHDKLSPAMSLLLVVGHVKDGMELAREFNIPKNVMHFIESHHGTTLVEFFYHRARQRAEHEGGPNAYRDDEGPETVVPDEFEYRYQGPKPRTREAAILMIADAVESAARALTEPTPSRVEALVRAIANKRLMDGQFDDCELTLRDLHGIVESVSRTVSSMYHGRIHYPVGEMEERRA